MACVCTAAVPACLLLQWLEQLTTIPQFWNDLFFITFLTNCDLYGKNEIYLRFSIKLDQRDRLRPDLRLDRDPAAVRADYSAGL
jgi:hypothetical protein